MIRENSPVIRGIVSFIGIDYYLLKKSGEENIAKFYLSGFFVILILGISFFSVFYAFELMFHRWYAELLLACFFSFTFLTIYLLLIQTFSKETLPTQYKLTFFNTSNITRICFVLLISFLIAQPVKIFLLSDKLDGDITTYKDRLYQAFADKNQSLYRMDLDKLYMQKQWYAKLSYDGASAQLINENEQKTAAISERIEVDNREALIKIESSDFFLKRVEFAGKYALSWWACLVIMMIFGLPVYLIYSISDDSKYYKEKKRFDHDLVFDKYQEFKKEYQLIFKDKYDKDVQFLEHFEDPPFNKVRKPEAVYSDDKEFYEHFVKHGL
jgi:hypothetical protein